MGIENQPARRQNIDALVRFFESGIKNEANTIGIELEHTLVHSDGRPVSYSDEFGQGWLLGQLAPQYETTVPGEDGRPIGLFRSGSSLTLEPGSQVELSAGPYRSLKKAAADFAEFEDVLNEACAPHGIEILTPGYHPTRRAVDLELIPKRRYKIMNEYLGAISMYGICMMRGSASTQISIDYTSVDDCLRKLRLANCLVPIISLICDNTPIFEAEPRPHCMMRTEIWEHCDPARCTGVPGVCDPDFTLEKYAEYILDTPAMVDASTGVEEMSSRTFGEIFSDQPMKRADIEHALSVFFTDVRLKTYIEIRPADAMPVECVIAYAAMIKGLFYNKASLDALDDLFDGVRGNDVRAAKGSLMANGYDGVVYGNPASEIADEVISIAALGLGEEERELLQPLVSMVSKRTTLARIASGETTDTTE